MTSEKQLMGKQLEYLKMLQNVLFNQEMTYYTRFITPSYQKRYEQFTAMLVEKSFSIDQIFSELRFTPLSDDQTGNRRETLIYQIHSRLSLPFDLNVANKFDGLIRKIVTLKDGNSLSKEVSDLINQWLELESTILEVALGSEFSSVDMNSSAHSNRENSSHQYSSDGHTDDELALAAFSAEGGKISNILSAGLGLGAISTTLLSHASVFLFLSYSASLIACVVTAVLSALLMGYALYLGCRPVTPGTGRGDDTNADNATDFDDNHSMLRLNFIR